MIMEIRNHSVNSATEYPTFNDLEKKNSLLRTLWEKEEKPGNQHFLLFPQYFVPNQ